MKIITDRIILSQLEISDIDIIHQYTTDYNSLTPFFTTKIKSKTFWKKRFEESGLWDDNYGMFKIIDSADSKFSGVVWFFKPPSQHSQLDFYEVAFNIFKPDKRNKGFASEALKVVSSYLFHTYPIQRVQSTTMLDINNNSIKKVTESTGFVYEGTIRKATFIRGKYIDMQLFSLLREESIALDSIIKAIEI